MLNHMLKKLSLLSLNEKVSKSFKTQLILEQKNIDEAVHFDPKQKLLAAINLFIFFKNSFMDPEQILNPGVKLIHEEYKCWQEIKLTQARQILKFSFAEISKLHYNVCRNYEALLSLDKISSKIFEYFSALMQCPKMVVNYFPRQDVPGYFGQVHECFKAEIGEREKIVEAALETSIIPEFDKIESFIRFLHDNYTELNTELSESKVREKFSNVQFDFTNLYILTRRVVDLFSIHQLVLLTNPLDDDLSFQQKIQSPSSAFSKRNPDRRTVIFYQHPHESAIGDMQKFALLGMLQRMGEILTGKHLQNRVSKSIERIDWELLVRIRNVLSHQDRPNDQGVYHNFLNVHALLSNNQLFAEICLELDLLQRLYFELIVNFYSKISMRILDRDQAESKYIEFWKNILAEETLAQTTENFANDFENTPVVNPMDAGELSLLRQQLKSNLSPESSIKVENVISGIMFCEGKQGKLKSDFFKEHPDDKQQKKKAASIFVRRNCEIKDTRTNLKRDAIKNANAEKNRISELQRNNNELPNMRKFYFKITGIPPNNTSFDNNHAVLEYAFFYLEKLNAIIIKKMGAIDSIEKRKKFVTELCDNLTTSKKFKYAVEFCFVQAISFLEKAKDIYPKINDVMQTDSELFKNFRNWFLHGNALLDFSEFSLFSKDSPREDDLFISFRSQIMPGFIYKLIYSYLLLKNNNELLQEKRNVAKLRKS